MSLNAVPLWALAEAGPPDRRTAVLVLEVGSESTYTAVKTGMAGYVSRIGTQEWAVASWPRWEGLYLHLAGNRVTRITSPHRTLNIPAGLQIPPRWSQLATTAAAALFVLVPPGAMPAGPSEVGEFVAAGASSSDAFEDTIADLARTGRLVGGLAGLVGGDPQLN